MLKRYITANRMYESSSKKVTFTICRFVYYSNHEVYIDIIRVVVKNSGSGQEYIHK